jgi:four helix bundle protein
VAKIERFEDLEVWKKAAAIGVQIYLLSEKGKLKNDFGAKDQIRRSASSISNNIAEGFEYNNNKDFIKFLRYAKGSCGELRSQLFILFHAHFITLEDYQQLYPELLLIARQIGGFIKYLKSTNQPSSNL